MKNLNANISRPNKAPKTQADCYRHAWEVLLNKLSKEEQEEIDLNKFAKNVAELGEEMFDKASKAVQVKG